MRKFKYGNMENYLANTNYEPPFTLASPDKPIESQT